MPNGMGFEQGDHEKIFPFQGGRKVLHAIFVQTGLPPSPPTATEERVFGISFTKILLIAAVIAVVWYGFKFISRSADDGAAEDKRAKKPKAPPPKPGDAANAVEEMVRCAVCGAFQARDAGPCERRDCPAR